MVYIGYTDVPCAFCCDFLKYRFAYVTIYILFFATYCIYTYLPLQVPVKQESDGDLTASINDVSSQEEDGLLADTMSEGVDSEGSQSGGM